MSMDDVGSVWIELIVAETEIWKHCNKIIFKCVNSVVGPVNSAWTVREQCMNSVFCPLHSKIIWFYCSRVGNKNWKCKTWTPLSTETKRVRCVQMLHVHGQCCVQMLYIKQLEFPNLSVYDSVKSTSKWNDRHIKSLDAENVSS